MIFCARSGVAPSQQTDTTEAATHEENRAEHAKDTRATEQSYLARGLAERVAALHRTEEALRSLELRTFASEEPIALSALVQIEDGVTRVSQTWWLVPAGGGIKIESSLGILQTVTPAAPLGRALIGLSVRDEGHFETPRGVRDFEILALR